MESTFTSKICCAAHVLQRMLIYLCCKALAVWHRFISPLLGPRCRFYPSCSQYAAEALVRHGLFKGAVLGIKRVFRCHPFCEGGLDFVPDPPENISNNAETGFQNN